MSQKNKKEVIEIPTINENWLKEHVYIIRNQKVMLDSDLAMIYGYEVKYLNRQVKRNIERFPEDFMFQVTKEEVEELRCQNVTANINTMSRTMPYVFSEQGIYMLATVLNGEIAIKQHKALIRMFKLMKDYIVKSGQINSLVEYSRTKNIDSAHERMNLLEARVQKIEEQLPEKVNTIDLIKMMEPFNEYKKDDFIIIYKGKPLQANIAYNDIYKSATKTIDIIDDYIGLRTLSLLTGVDKDITIKIYSHNMSEINEDAFNSFVKECPCRIKIYKIPAKEIHDRVVVIDKKNTAKGYISGCSSKDSGDSLSAIIESSAALKLLKEVADKHKNDVPIYSNR